MPDAATIRLLFIATQKFESGKAIRGAFLLTDGDTRPLEFRCTNPIRPSTLQTVLYGDSLQQHILIELIGLPLVNAVKQQANLVVVKEPELLHLRPRIQIPLVQVAKEDSIPISSAGDAAPTALLSSTSGRFDPVILLTHPKSPADREHAKVVLTEIFNSHDLAEPFNRIALALEQVHAQKVGEDK